MAVKEKNFRFPTRGPEAKGSVGDQRDTKDEDEKTDYKSKKGSRLVGRNRGQSMGGGPCVYLSR